MIKFTYEDFKTKIRESLRPRPAPVLAQQGSVFKRILNRAKAKRQGPGL
jgi:hypothetical protein